MCIKNDLKNLNNIKVFSHLTNQLLLEKAININQIDNEIIKLYLHNVINYILEKSKSLYFITILQDYIDSLDLNNINNIKKLKKIIDLYYNFIINKQIIQISIFETDDNTETLINQILNYQYESSNIISIKKKKSIQNIICNFEMILTNYYEYFFKKEIIDFILQVDIYRFYLLNLYQLLNYKILNFNLGAYFLYYDKKIDHILIKNNSLKLRDILKKYF